MTVKDLIQLLLTRPQDEMVFSESQGCYDALQVDSIKDLSLVDGKVTLLTTSHGDW